MNHWVVGTLVMGALLVAPLSDSLAQTRDRPLEGVRSFWTTVGIPVESRQGPCAIERDHVDQQIIARLRAASLSVVSFNEILRLQREHLELTQQATGQVARGGRLPESFDANLERRRQNLAIRASMATFGAHISTIPVASLAGEPGCALAINLQVVGDPTAPPTLEETGRPVAAPVRLWSRGYQVVFIPAATWESGLSARLTETLDTFIEAWRAENTPPANTGTPAPRATAPSSGR